MDDRPILGVSADLHDAAAAIVVGGTVLAAAAEERFTRVKHDGSLPVHAMRWCLEDAGVAPGGLGAVAFNAKPLTAYERILSTHARAGPAGVAHLAASASRWTRSKLWVAYRIEEALRQAGHPQPTLLFAEHHLAHAAAAFFPSPFAHAALVTMDGVGEWTTSSIGHGSGSSLELLAEQRFPDSLGLFYSTMTAHCGFAVNDGEYKLMGLAPYGQPVFAEALRDHVIDIRADGSIRLAQRFFGFRQGGRMGSRALDRLLGPPLALGAEVGEREADLAASTQVVVEEAVLAAARHAHALTGEDSVCLAGGVALNCVANGRLAREGPFREIWVQPAAGDDGGALGAALWAWHQVSGRPRTPGRPDGMAGAALGPSYRHDDIAAWLGDGGVGFAVPVGFDALCALVADELAAGAVVGWFRGRMEMGPRALGHRSILADPRDPAMVARINRAVKQREGFRPFAPAVLAEEAAEWFDLDGASPYMLQAVPVRNADVDPADGGGSFAGRLAGVRSAIPACTHVDRSARVQTVDEERSPDLHRLLRAFADRTGVPVLLNTSFNGRGEPIVRSPADALRCFAATGLDLLVLEGCVVRPSDLPAEVASPARAAG